MLTQKVNYIHQNPVTAGLVERAEDYPWSSVRIWKRCPLEEERLLVDIDRINWRARQCLEASPPDVRKAAGFPRCCSILDFSAARLSLRAE